MSVDMSQFYEVFFEEAAELLAEMETLLLKLDLDSPDVEDLNAIFRAAHSIKGGAATFGFADMTEVTHVLETLLDRLRKGELAPTSEMVDAFLTARDVLQEQLAGHRGDGSPDAQLAQEVCAVLNRLASDGPTPASGDPAPAAVQAPVDERPSEAVPQQPVVSAPGSGKNAYRIEFALSGSVNANRAILHNLRNAMNAVGMLDEVSGPQDDDAVPATFIWRVNTDCPEEDVWEAFAFLIDPTGLTIQADEGAAQSEDEGYGFFEPVASTPTPVSSDPSGPMAKADGEGSEFYQPLYDALVPPENQEQPAAVPQASTTSDAAANTSGQPRPVPHRRASDQPGALREKTGRRESDKAAGSSETTSIRVSVEKVDQLINLVGELVITQAMLAQTANRLDDADNEELVKSMGLLERNTRDLQEAVMSIRMMPISFVFSRFPRVVRDLAGKLGKQVELKTVGEGTELDKGLIEKIADPLTHLVRNSIDHGIEMPEARKAGGKPVKGTITLRAFHHGGSIVIEVGDDGAGLDRERILAKARDRGLPVSDSMSDQEVWMLIFEAGFSTAQVVTDVSGRGVGMDVVRRNIQALGGSIEIDSAAGVGTRMSIRLPLTLAILDGLSVRVGKQLYIVPLTYIVESLQPRTEDIKTITGGSTVIHVRGEYLPILRAHEVFGEHSDHCDMSKGIIVILESDGVKKAFYVDELLGQHQVVIKSLESNYRKVHGISGATIMGDGRVGLILDVGELVRGRRGELRAAA